MKSWQNNAWPRKREGEENIQEQGLRPDLLRRNNGDQTRTEESSQEQEMILRLTLSRGDEARRPPGNRHDPTKDSFFPTSSNKETRPTKQTATPINKY